MIPQPSLEKLSGRTRNRLAPDSQRVDLLAPAFSNPTQVTNPLFPISNLHSAVLVGIYEGKAGKQFSDALVVKMPGEQRSRHLIHQLLTKLPKKLRAGVVPEPDTDEGYLFATFD